MRACVFKEPYTVVVQEHEIPKLTDRSVLVNVELAGICGSDLEVYRGKRNIRTPVIMGHEAVGRVVEVGEGVEKLKPGDRVVIEPNVYCGKCYYCRKGRMDICENKIVYGITRNGVFSEYVDAPESFVWKVPETVQPEAAVLIEPLSVVLHAIRHLSLSLSDNVLVIGGGPIGAIAAEVLQLMNVNVVVTEIVGTRIKILRDIGVKRVVDASKDGVDEEIRQHFDGSKADYVLDTVASSGSFAQVFKWLRPGGKAVILGLLSHKAEIDVFPLVRGSMNIEGSIIYLGDYIDALKLIKREDVSQKLVKIITHKFKLDECGKAFEVAASGNCLKVVLDMRRGSL